MEVLLVRRLIVPLAVVAWAGLIAVGARAFYLHEVTAGERAAEAPHWPMGSTLPRAATGATLIMFVHPSCPCSRASVAELASLAAPTLAHAQVLVVFVTDETGGPLWDSAGRILGAHRVLDRDGAEAARFGAMTSGHVVIYGARGELAYAGGITGSRGHAGDNMGKRSIVNVLEGLAPINAHYDVFGCGLFAHGGRP